MKIAYFLHTFPRLHNTFILNEIVQLKEKGNEVYIFSIHKSQDKVVNREVLSLKDTTFYFEDFLIEHNQYLIRHFFRVVKKLYTHSYFFRRLTAKVLIKSNRTDIDVAKYHKGFGWKIYALGLVAKKIQRDEIDIIHAGFANKPATAAMILSGLAGVPFSFEAHAYDLFVDFDFAKEKIEKAKKIFTISNYNKQYLIDHFKCPPSKIVVNRVPINKNHCDKIPGKPRSDSLITSVCRLHPTKGLEYAIEAFKLISQKRQDLRFTIIGGGPLENQLLEKVAQISLGDKVTFLGDISNEDAIRLISQSTMMVIPSVIAGNGDRDGIPTALIEAMYLKTPVIGSKISGIPELIEDGINGFLTEPGDVRGIADKMEKLLSDDSLRIAMGEAARRKVDNAFNVETNCAKLIHAWE
ncbi:MAG: glycosyltransferase [Pseudomonadota bacterium]